MLDKNKIRRRIARARETQAMLARVRADPSPANVAALHRLHADHLREDGDHGGAERAESRAERARAESGEHPEGKPPVS
jgi:hypothetical protein